MLAACPLPVAAAALVVEAATAAEAVVEMDFPQSGIPVMKQMDWMALLPVAGGPACSQRGFAVVAAAAAAIAVLEANDLAAGAAATWNSGAAAVATSTVENDLVEPLPCQRAAAAAAAACQTMSYLAAESVASVASWAAAACAAAAGHLRAPSIVVTDLLVSQEALLAEAFASAASLVP